MPLDAGRLAEQAATEIAQGQRDEGAEHARTAVQLEPLNPAALRSLAASMNPLADRAKIHELMEQAARVSLRDTASHGFLMEDAFERGDYKRAVFHADMLLRRNAANQSVVFEVLSQILTDPNGREALADRLRFYPPWRSPFLREAGQYGPPDELGDLLRKLNASGSPVRDEDSKAFFGRLVAEGQFAKAQLYWRLLVAGASSSGDVYDGDFDGRPGPPPLNWQALEAGGGDAVWRTQDGGSPGILNLRHDGFTPASPLIRELVILSPGEYLLEAKAEASDFGSEGRFRVQIRCVSGHDALMSLPIALQVAHWDLARSQFSVPEVDCGAQWLEFLPVAGELRQDLEANVDHVEIRSLAPQNK